MIGHDDKRDFYRMMVNTECQVTVVDAEAQQDHSALCRDLSANGMAVEIDVAVDMGKTVEVHIRSTNAQIPSLDAKGKVIRCSKESDNLWLLGIEIQEIV
ncbi:PilZ domain-containing protein [Catenovulum sp. SM1970]|uniref:PilZ domain-containing protein n=1 Tax=Marinifaba aquimaris TaxID=2741323 RepID=UPI001571EA0F|nr:PilZ domain-containing protein [Marinifaba aquimaris]NTS78548.1 PilZ domain-containing protein [Marinifaba aquimaris]